MLRALVWRGLAIHQPLHGVLDNLQCLFDARYGGATPLGHDCHVAGSTLLNFLAAVAAGNPVNALGQAIAQQQFNQLVDVMTYEELYEYFGGASSPPEDKVTW